MPRLIDADALERKWQYVLDEKADEKGTVAYVTFELFIERLREEPTIDPERLRPHGRWVPVDCEQTCDEWDCTACGQRRTFLIEMGADDMEEFYPYCPNCGAKMDLEEEQK